MSKDNQIIHLEDNFFDDEYLEQKENTANFKSQDEVSNLSKDHSTDKYITGKYKAVNYIQNYKNNFKNTGYSELQKKKKILLTNFTTNITPNKTPEPLVGLNTINYEPNYIAERELLRDSSHSPVKQKLVDALNNIDNIFVKITKKENKKIDNFQMRRASNFREKTKNSLTSLVNIVNNQAIGQNISSSNIIGDTSTNKEKNVNIRETNTNNTKPNPIASNSNIGKCKLYQRNVNNSQHKSNEITSEINNETSDEALIKNSMYNTQNKKEIKSKSNNDLAFLLNNAYNNETNLSEKENVYKRPPRNHKRDLSQETMDIKSIGIHIDSNNKPTESVGDGVENNRENDVKTSNKVNSKENLMESNRNLDNLNSTSSLAKNINKYASSLNDNKFQLSTSTITENQRSLINKNNNLQFIHDESIKDHASEEKEIFVDSFIQIKKRFLEIVKTTINDKLCPDSSIPIATACKISNEILTEMKSDGDKEVYDLMNKNKDLKEKNSELTEEIKKYKENQYKSSNNTEKSLIDMSNTIKDLQRYVLKLEKENVVLKNEFINNIKNKNGMIKKFNEDLGEYQNITRIFQEKYSEIENIEK